MNHFRTSAECKAIAREQLLGHYGTAIGAYLLTGGIFCAAALGVGFLSNTDTVVGASVYYAIMFLVSVLFGLLRSGLCYLYLKILCGHPVRLGDLFYGFRLCPDKAVGIQAWLSFLTCLAGLPQMVLAYKFSASFHRPAELLPLMLPYALSLIFSGVVDVFVGLIYAQAFFLLHDFPQYTTRELLRKSRRLMAGHKGRLFYLEVSFLPLMLLGLFSCGLALLWALPYMAAAEAAFFLDLMQKSQPNGAV